MLWFTRFSFCDGVDKAVKVAFFVPVDTHFAWIQVDIWIEDVNVDQGGVGAVCAPLDSIEESGIVVEP